MLLLLADEFTPVPRLGADPVVPDDELGAFALSPPELPLIVPVVLGVVLDLALFQRTSPFASRQRVAALTFAFWPGLVVEDWAPAKTVPKDNKADESRSRLDVFIVALHLANNRVSMRLRSFVPDEYTL